MNNTNQLLASLSPEKKALLEMRLRQKNGSNNAPFVSSVKFDEPCPLSFAQESLWFFDQLVPNSPLYNIPQALRLTGELNVEAIRKSFEAIVNRHKILRTTFPIIEGKPMQVVSDKPFEFPIIDLTSCSEEQQRQEVQRHLDDEAKQPFQLAKDLMLRAKLLRLREDEHILLFSLHHIAGDAWSLRLLYQELETLYAAFSAGQRSPLPEPSHQYAAFAICQRERLQGELAKNQIEYWNRQLSGDLPVLELPTDRARPLTQSFRGARKTIHLPQSLLQGLIELSRQENATLYIVLLAAWQTLLHRYSHQEEVLVGSPIGARNNRETEKLIGLFLNIVALRANFSGDPSFRELIQQVRNTVFGAFANPDIPLERLVEELKVPRNPGRNPLFQTVFQFLAASPQTPAFPDLNTEMLPMETGTAKFDLTLTLADSRDGLTGDLEYSTDLFEAAAIDRMLGHFKVLLESAVADPSQKISALPLLTKSEAQSLLADWNNTTTDYPKNASIAELFEKQVALTPDSVALIFGDAQWTYNELNTRANQLAHHLKRFGVCADTLVGVCLERSADLVVSLLAILKAGGAYVPLDASYPAERLAHMIQDTSARVLITNRTFKERRFTDYAGNVVCLDTDATAISKYSSENPPNASNGESLAYVIYTSGSTGKPKGVAIPQRGVVRLVKNTNYLQFSADDVFLLFAPVSFDASTLEIWGPLLNGGKLVVFPSSITSLEQLGEILERHHVTTLWLTAGLFHEMVEEHLGSLRGIRKLLAGGDVLSGPHVRKVLCELPDTELINGYGPTENTTFTCCCSVPRSWDGRSVPIGRPISNTQVYILDKHLQPVPVGVPGELFIGGDGLAREYLNAPELTVQKFIPNPFVGDANFKLYRTGDLVRWLPDGNIEFLGRLDHQVKIRGFRVELAEIENALVQHPSVREAHIAVREDQSGGKQLVAYVIADSKQNVDVPALRSFVETKLPRYMVPSHFVLMEKFPLTANGKIDRRLLPVPEHDASGDKNFVAPQTVQEQTIAQIWCEVLKLEQVGIHENFFDLGGHSLLATRIISRINSAFGTDLPLSTVFEKPTICAFASLIPKDSKPSVRRPIIPRRRRVQTPAQASVVSNRLV